MKNIFKLCAFFLMVLIISACGGKPDTDYYNNATKLLKDGKYEESLTEFEALLQAHPESEFACNAKFEIAKLYQGKVVKTSGPYESGKKSVDYFEKVYTDHPDNPLAPQALFMAGFIYANELNDLNRAKDNYELFLLKYPQSDLADDAEMELQNLGKTPEEILQNVVPQ
ncbi:MAG: outer membrane protein assembly factor BamD [Ignavibacteriales bacterium]|nr:outer membrane protein assembly factor BamD [Ignavibacteriales bacterium]MCF8435728.1 outer membrane protein assembly factor BamD [Ignavibacteriales bacterium]